MTRRYFVLKDAPMVGLNGREVHGLLEEVLDGRVPLLTVRFQTMRITARADLFQEVTES